MGVRECIGDLDRDRNGTSEFERPPGDELSHVLSGDKLHRDVEYAVRTVKIVDRADVRMVELRAKLSLTLKSFEIRGLRRQFRRQDLDDRGAIQLGVESLVNRALAAGADLFEDLVLVDLRTDHKICGTRNAAERTAANARLAHSKIEQDTIIWQKAICAICRPQTFVKDRQTAGQPGWIVQPRGGSPQPDPM